MTKYGRYLSFGYAIRPSAADPARPLQLAALAEKLGFDYLTIQRQPDDAEEHDLWTLLTAVGMQTSRIALVANGSEAPLRSPAALAKAAASLDLLTRGRVHLALSAQAPWHIDLKEAIETMRRVWSGEQTAESADDSGQPGTETAALAPARRINIWLSTQEPELLGVAGALGDAWSPDVSRPLEPNQLAQLGAQVDGAVASAGRELYELQRVWYISGTIGDQEHDVPFQGTAQQWADSLADLAVNVGIDTFILMEGENAEEQLERFAKEVIPLTVEGVQRLGGLGVPIGLANARLGADASGATPIEEAKGQVDVVDESSMESFPASDPPASSSFT